MKQTSRTLSLSLAAFISILIVIFSCNKPVELPTISTNDVSEITHTSAICGGNIIENGGDDIIDKGVVWSTFELPTYTNNDDLISIVEGENEFICEITGLIPNTTYHIRAFATNSEGVGYGNQRTFTTYSLEDLLPVLNIKDITDITHEQANSGGIVISDGGYSVTARGIVWNTEENPTFENNVGITEDGSGDGEFTSVLAPLNHSTTYYVKAYATNSFGTTYSNQLEFETPFALFDIDGNNYQFIEVNGKRWMAENLKVTKYNNGSNVSTNLSNYDWNNNIDGAYSIYPYNSVDGINSSEEMLMIYGALYNWQAATNHKGLCPTGWRLPTDVEWQELEKYLGMDNTSVATTGWRGTNQGGKHKSIQTYPDNHPRWLSPNTSASNSFGFNAIPSGFKHYEGDYQSFGENGLWWTLTTNENVSAYYRTIQYDRATIGRFYAWNNYGFSIRCVEN